MTPPAPLRAAAPPDGADRARPRAVTVGLVLFAVGLALVVVAVVPFFLGHHDRPLWLNLGCLLAPVGAVTATWGGLARGRAEARAALAATRERAAARAAAGAAPAPGVGPPGSGGTGTRTGR